MDDMERYDYYSGEKKDDEKNKKKRHRVNRRFIIRLYSFAAAALLIGIGFYLKAHEEQKNSERQSDAVFARAFSEVTTQICSIETSLNKLMYVTDLSEMITLSSDMFRQVGFAKAYLGQLPLAGADLTNMQRFLAQAGDYIYSLTKKAVKSEVISTDDTASISMLHDYASKLALKLVTVQDLIVRSDDGGKVTDILSAADMTSSELSDIGGFREVGQIFADYPRLIYDGPFSSNRNEAPYRYIENMAELERDEAMEAASNAFSITSDKLIYNSMTKSNLPAYNFSTEDKFLQVTQKGGVLLSVLSDRKVESQILSDDEAIGVAYDFLAGTVQGEFKHTYYLIDNNVLVANFAPFEDSVVYYPDLIKIGVALDNGEIVFYEACGFIKNHMPRELPKDILTPETASAAVSGELIISSQGLAVIPSDYGNELFCYEFKCTNSSGKEFISYVNAQTGIEEELLVIIDTGRGKLTM